MTGVSIEVKENSDEFPFDETFDLVMILTDTDSNVKARVAGTTVPDLLDRAARFSERWYEHAGEVKILDDGSVQR